MDPLSTKTRPDSAWFVFALPAIIEPQYLSIGFLLFSIFMGFLTIAILTWVFTSGGYAWKNGRTQIGPVPIHGPRGLPVLGSLFGLSRGLAHKKLARMASSGVSTRLLMALSLGSNPIVVTSNPKMAHEILNSPHFSSRPLKRSANSLMFGRAIGFAPSGPYWRFLRKIAATHLFSPKRIAAHEPSRQLDCEAMVRAIEKEQTLNGIVVLRNYLQDAAINNIMGTVFGKRYDFTCNDSEIDELREMIKEGFELLGAFNWSDYVPWLSYFYDPLRIHKRCASLVPRVRRFVTRVIDEHRRNSRSSISDSWDFVDVLLSLYGGEEELSEEDMVAILWEMIFRGTDTTALLTEWIMAELTLNPNIQTKLQQELDSTIGNNPISDADVAKLPYLQAVVKETLRLHPPGPLLSWARLSTSDVQLRNGMVVPHNTTAMVNMWAITHDPEIWSDPLVFEPDRFVRVDFDVKGSDLRLAPFGSGRRSCPGKNLALVTVSRWVAELVNRFEWVQDAVRSVDLTEMLKLSCEMETPLAAIAIPRN